MTKKFKGILTILILLSSLLYLYLQFFILTPKPAIEIYKYPKNTVQSSVLLKGRALEAKKLFIFGKEVFLDTNLEFKKEIFLFPGINKINIKIQAKDDSFREKNIQIFRTKKI